MPADVALDQEAGAEALLELETGAPAAGGGFVAHAPDGRVVFVRHALPGERVAARVTSETRSFLRADAVEILRASPDRVAPPCPASGPGRCGGCDYQHVDLAAQRALKAAMVAEQLLRVAGLEHPVEVEEAPGAPGGLGWRTRVRFAVDRSGHVGLRRHRSHQLQLLEHCPLASPGIEALGLEAARWPGARDLEAFVAPDGAAVLSIERGPRRPGTPQRVDLPEGLDAGVVVNGQVRRQPDHLTVQACGRDFVVHAGVFWQVHPAAADLLGTAVLEALDPRPGQHAVDLFAGAGLFSALLADRVGPTGAVLAVERDPRACGDARANTAEQHWVKTVRAEVTAELVATRLGSPDLVVLDPARQGAGTDVMAALADLESEPTVAYVSCDAASFARDVKVLLDDGWELVSLRAFDLFPMTEHVELLGVLRPKRA